MVDMINGTAGLNEILGPQLASGLDFLIKLGIGLGIVVIVYILYLIIKGFFGMRTASRIKNILKNVEEINKKFDILFEKKSKEREKNKK